MLDISKLPGILSMQYHPRIWRHCHYPFQYYQKYHLATTSRLAIYFIRSMIPKCEEVRLTALDAPIQLVISAQWRR